MKWLFLLIAFCSLFSAQGQEGSGIFINQAGFYPKSVKTAIVDARIDASAFYVLTADRHDTVFSETLGLKRESAYSSITTREVNFTAFQKPGTYILCVGKIYSAPFTISTHAADGVAKAVVKGYYYQRSNMPLEEKFAGIWHRGAGHPDTAVLVHPSAATAQRPAGTVVSTPGGWYDAGDYNKYIVNSGITMGTLLAAYEDFPLYFDSSFVNIPESGNGLPDLLNEARYNLLWMLTMQDEDGGVYHKCTNADFDAFVMPGVTKAPRYVVQKSTAATLDFAAVMAQSARIFQKFSVTRAWSDTCLRAAERAWQWALLHPQVAYSQRSNSKQFAPAITTGEYGDDSFKDEWLWAASELLTTTGKNEYLPVVTAHFDDPLLLPGWSTVGMMGYATLIRHRKGLSAAAADIAEKMKYKLLQFAGHLGRDESRNAFRTVMGESERNFSWGSNAVAANQAMVLIWAYRLSGRTEFLNGAISNFDYLLGRNATGYCFVTGMGNRSPMHPHHRPSAADGIAPPVPGLLVGGPNPGRQDGCAYTSLQTETSYIDSACAYASNEIAINWNAPMVYLAGALEAILGH